MPKQCLFWLEALVNAPIMAVVDSTEKGSGASGDQWMCALCLTSSTKVPLSIAAVEKQKLIDFEIFKGHVNFVHNAIPRTSPTFAR